MSLNGDQAFMELTLADFEYIRSMVRQCSAIALEDGKEYLAETRLSALARKEGLLSAAELLARFRHGRDHSLQRKIVEAMTTNETSFFR